MAQSTSHHMHSANRFASVVAIVMCIVIAGMAAAGPPQIDFHSVRTRPPALEFVGGSGTGGGHRRYGQNHCATVDGHNRER